MNKTSEQAVNRAALFDLDGVLIDTEGIYTDFWMTVGRRYGKPDRFAYDIKGTTLTDILTRNFPDPEVQKTLVEEIHRFEDTMVYRVFPGVREFLDRIKADGWHIAIVTSSDNTKMEYLYQQQPWMRDYFETVVTGSMVTKSKPDPEGYMLAARLTGCDSRDCVVFEDSLQGLEAGRRAGGRVVGLATTNSREKIAPLADEVIDSFEGFTL